MRITNNTPVQGYAYQTISGLVVGKTYIVSWDNSAPASAYATRATVSTVESGSSPFASTAIVQLGTRTLTFVAGATSYFLTLWLFTATAGVSMDFDNISVKLANEDRSVNNNGLAVNGTITVAPVETGAETMAYSGFSASNYLEQPYNSALDFGTSDFYVMGWVKGTDTDGKIIIRRTASLSDDRIALDVSASLYRFYVDTGSNLITSTASATTGVWTFVCGIRKSGVLFLYVDGALQGTGINASDLSNSDAVLNIGQHPTLNDPYGGSLSRWRIGAGAPTPEQIRKIYRDELPLYREDAACTINGTSSAVTAMASDPVTGLLQVGTSGGLSAFRGLQRVEQDTTAVTTTISANGATVARQ